MRWLLIVGCLLLLNTSIVTGVSSNEEVKAVEVGKTYSLQSKILGQKRHINVYLPASYADNSKYYPVLYLLDGGVEEDFLHIVGIASLAADFRNMREFIVVGIEGVDRYHDLVHTTTLNSYRNRLPTSGGASTFRAFLAEELQPFIKKQFRTTEETVLMGESAAGLFVVETLLQEPTLFESYIAVSPMLWWDAGSLAKQSAYLLKKKAFTNRRLYLTIADEGGEVRQAVDLLVDSLKTSAPKDMEWTFVPMEQESHATTFHPAALQALRKFFAITKI